MTEKRFTIIDSDSHYVGYDIKDNQNFYKRYYGGRLIQAEELCDLLNELHEENMLLKGENAHYKLLLMSLKEQADRICRIPKAKDGGHIND